MKWPWQRRHDDDSARKARAEAEQTLSMEQRRVDEAAVLARRLAAHRAHNEFAEAMRIALGGHR